MARTRARAALSPAEIVARLSALYGRPVWRQPGGAVPGVGPKPAACVLMFAVGRPALPVDTHVGRVAQRLGLVPAGTGTAEAHDLPEAGPAPGGGGPFSRLLLKH